MTYILPVLYVIVSYTFFPLPLMVLFGLVTIVFLIFGYGILLGQPLRNRLSDKVMQRRRPSE